MPGTVTRDSAWYDFPSFCSEISEGPVVLVVNAEATVCAKPAYLPSVVSSSIPRRPAIPIATRVIRHLHPLDSLRYLLVDRG